MIYSINNNAFVDVEEPSEESGCGHRGIVSLSGEEKKKAKKVNYFPK